MNSSIETVIVGGGQAGLSAAYFLQRAGREALVLERSGLPGNTWREDRWDSFTLVTPNWGFRLPGGEYQASDPNGFMPRQEIVRRFEYYVSEYHLPVSHNISVLSVETRNGGYVLRSDRGDFLARNVIIATGLFQKHKIPPSAAGLDARILQLHSSKYRNSQNLPDGAVLVVGAGQSGAQIAEELCQAGRQVYLSVGSGARAPRRYRGRDIYEWVYQSGYLDRTIDQLASPHMRFASNPQLSGKDGGRSLNLHRFFRDGVILLGRFQAVSDGRLIFASDLKQNLLKIDTNEVNILKGIDDYIARAGIDAPLETIMTMNDAYAAPEILTLDPYRLGISSVIWANGYAYDFSLVKLPVVDEFGFPVTRRGVTRFPGLYFLGMPWLHTQKGGLLLGVSEDAAFVVNHLAGRPA